ncbi:MAG: NADH-quinone oxidoreductase subunit NuoG [Mariprofundaceae bacterium]|nr:NADH-quinone oxidoreductase subunit NuoG [Mariprofundaceae bacterium]
MTTLFINEEEVTVAAGTSILEACRQSNVDVPYFCYHPELSVAANCRMCLVNVEGWPKPPASCCTPVSEGMKVSTESEALVKDREMAMEYLLIHHPLDCPVCDQGGECKLQDYAMEHGSGKGRYLEEKRIIKDKQLGPFVTTSMTRCIHCTRCVRFADEIAGTGDMGVLNRGDHMEISSVVDECLSSELSGNLPDICPVGALLDGPSHDVSRPWEMTRHQSTCTQCPQGCDISIESRGQDVMRIQPIEGSPEPWLCDRGRFVYDAFRNESRLLKPISKQEKVSWNDAINDSIALLKDKRIGIICSPDWSVEGLSAIRLLRDTAFKNAPVAFDLHRRDKRSFAFEEGFSQTTQQIEDADQVVILGSDLRQRLPLVMQRIRKRVLADKPVVRIGSMRYRTNSELQKDMLIRPRDWVSVIASAIEQVMALGKQAAGMQAWLDATQDRHEAGKVLADALLAETCSLLVGEEIRCHNDAAALIHGLDLLMRGCGHAEANNDGRNLIPEGMNAQALTALFAKDRMSVSDIFEDANQGKLDAILLIGSDPIGDGLFPVQAREALKKVALIQIGAIQGEISDQASVLLPASAYSEVEGTFINMEGRVRTAHHPLEVLGDQRPLWKIMMRLLQALGQDIPAVSLEELRIHMHRFIPELTKVDDKQQDAIFLSSARNRKSILPTQITLRTLDVVSRYSMYREGMWARSSELLRGAGERQKLADVIMHPDTLAAQAGSIATLDTDHGQYQFKIDVRDDISPGVLFISKRGIAGDISNVVSVDINGGSA